GYVGADVGRPRCFPAAAGEHALATPVGIHNEDLAVLLERVVVKRRLVAETVHAAVPHNPAVRGPYRVTVGRAVCGEPQQVRAVRPDREDVEVDCIHTPREEDSAPVGRPAGQVVLAGGPALRRAILEVEDAQPVILLLLAPDAIDDLFAVRGIAREAGVHRAIGERFEPGAVPAYPHDPCVASAARLEP